MIDRDDIYFEHFEIIQNSLGVFVGFFGKFKVMSRWAFQSAAKVHFRTVWRCVDEAPCCMRANQRDPGLVKSSIISMHMQPARSSDGQSLNLCTRRVSEPLFISSARQHCKKQIKSAKSAQDESRLMSRRG